MGMDASWCSSASSSTIGEFRLQAIAIPLQATGGVNTELTSHARTRAIFSRACGSRSHETEVFGLMWFGTCHLKTTHIHLAYSSCSLQTGRRPPLRCLADLLNNTLLQSYLLLVQMVFRVDLCMVTDLPMERRCRQQTVLLLIEVIANHFHTATTA